MRLKNYLVEQAGRTKNLSLDEAVVIVKKNCMKAYNAYKNESSQIFRGIDESSYSCGYIDPKKGVRRSANTTNHYTLIMDNSSKWTKYPKRSQSIICSSSQRSAGSYGTLYMVLPYDKARIGVCPEGDIWYSFGKTLKYTMNTFNENIEKLFEYINVKSADKSIKNLKNACKEFDSKITNYDISKLIDVDWLKYYKGDLWNLFEKLVDPTTNGFKISKPGDNLPKEKEVWTDGSSILIKENMWYEFHNTMEEY